VIRRFCSSACLIVSFGVIVSATSIVSSAQSPTAASQKDAAPEQQAETTAETKNDKTMSVTPHAQPADVSGDWQVSWEVRMGTNPGTLRLQQNGAKLTGTFKDLHGLSSLSGTVENGRISFDVQFQGKYPFTTRFTGTLNNNKIEGSSQAIDVKGEGGAFLGHGGEVQHPDHPWTASRVTGDPARSSEPSSATIPPAKN
jgi:hypothetical protein